LVPVVGGGVSEIGSQDQEVKGDDGKPGEGIGANAGGETRPLEYRTNRDQPVFMPVAYAGGQNEQSGKPAFNEHLFWEIVRAMKGGQEAADWFFRSNGRIQMVRPRSWWDFPKWWDTMSDRSRSGYENRGGFNGGAGAWFQFRGDLDELEAALEFMKQMSGDGTLGRMYLGWLDTVGGIDAKAFQDYYQGALRDSVIQAGIEGGRLYIEIIGSANGGTAAVLAAVDLGEGRPGAAGMAGGSAGAKLLGKLRQGLGKAVKPGEAKPPPRAEVPETGGSAGAKGGANTARQTPPPHQAKPSKHHFAAIENKEFTPRIKEITDKYGLDLDGAWNKELLPWNNGRHPKEYHDWVLDQMQRADIEAAGNVEKFLELIEKYVKKPVRENPEMLRKFYW
jgi:hypothetical protein